MANEYTESPRPSDNGEVRLSEDAILIAERCWYSPSTGTVWASRYNAHYGRFLPLRILKDKARHGYHTISSRKSTPIIVHRAAWAAIYGPIPDGMVIDHINGIKNDNRIINLRLISIKENVRKRKLNKNNTIGFSNVRPWRSKYAACIQEDGILKRLGVFLKKEDAYAAYLDYKARMHGGLSVSHLPQARLSPPG